MLSLLELWAVVLYPTPLCCMNSYLGSLSLTQSSLILQQPPQRLYGQLIAGWGCRLCLSRGHMHIGLRLQTNHVVFWYLICCQWGFYVDIVQGIGLPTFIIHSNLDLICWVFCVSSHSSPIALALKCCHECRSPCIWQMVRVRFSRLWFSFCMKCWTCKLHKSLGCTA